MKLRSLLMVLLIGGLTWPATSVRAGGGSWTFEGNDVGGTPIFVPGDAVHARTGLWLEGVKPDSTDDLFWGGPQHGPYFGYLLSAEGLDQMRTQYYPPPVPESAIYLGQVTFSEPAGGSSTVALDFVMPDVPPGDYYLMHCNDPCDRQIGDLMTTAITVVQDQGQAFLMGNLDRLDRRTFNMRHRFRAQLRAAIRSSARDVGNFTERLEERIETLEDRPIPRSATVSEDKTPAMLLGAVIGAAVATLLQVWLSSRRRAVPKEIADRSVSGLS